MLPVQFGLLLRFATEIHAYSHSQRILETLGVKVTKTETLPERGVRLRVEQDKVAVVWQPNLCHITIENVSNPKHCIDVIMELLKGIVEIAPIDKTSRRMFNTFWILPAPNYNFASLERKYRDMMIVENEISSVAYDSSVILDISSGKWTLHHQSGPMAPPQLHQTYLRFKLDKVPKTFVFLEATMLDNDLIQFSLEETHNFMEKSLDDCVSHSELFHQFWEGRL